MMTYEEQQRLSSEIIAQMNYHEQQIELLKKKLRELQK